MSVSQNDRPAKRIKPMCKRNGLLSHLGTRRPLRPQPFILHAAIANTGAVPPHEMSRCRVTHCGFAFPRALLLAALAPLLARVSSAGQKQAFFPLSLVSWTSWCRLYDAAR